MNLEEIRNNIIKSGLPVYTSRTAKQMRDAKLYTEKRAKHAKLKIDTKHICGWWKYSGIYYIPLYKEQKD